MESVCSNQFVHNDHEIEMSYVISKRGENVQLMYWDLDGITIYKSRIPELKKISYFKRNKIKIVATHFYIQYCKNYLPHMQEV